MIIGQLVTVPRSQVFGVAPVPPRLRGTAAELHAAQSEHRLLRAGHGLALGTADGRQVACLGSMFGWDWSMEVICIFAIIRIYIYIYLFIWIYIYIYIYI